MTFSEVTSFCRGHSEREGHVPAASPASGEETLSPERESEATAHALTHGRREGTEDARQRKGSWCDEVPGQAGRNGTHLICTEEKATGSK